MPWSEPRAPPKTPGAAALQKRPSPRSHHLGVRPDSITGQAEGALQLILNGVKVEFGDHHLEGIILYPLEELAAMKLKAIANRSSKEDFYDIAALLETRSLDTTEPLPIFLFSHFPIFLFSYFPIFLFFISPLLRPPVVAASSNP